MKVVRIQPRERATSIPNWLHGTDNLLIFSSQVAGATRMVIFHGTPHFAPLVPAR